MSNKMGMLDSLKGENRALRVLSDLVDTINRYNEGDMLEGYLNDLSEFNSDLELLGLPTIKEVATDE